MASKAIEFGEKTQNKGYYAVQGHSKSSRSMVLEKQDKSAKRNTIKGATVATYM